MDKEEILAKAKKENVYGDEREKTVRTRRDAFSCWGVLILGIIIMIIKISQGQSPADIIAIFFCMSGMGFTYEGIKLKKKWVIIVAVILLLLAAYSFYKFCEGIF